MPDNAPIQWLTAARSDPGRDPNKQINEDAYRVCEFPDGLLVVVCDGMGGHLGGQMASRAAVTTIEHEWRATGPSDEPRRKLEHCIGRASAEVFALGGQAAVSERPGSTCVAAWFGQGGLYIAHVGDSRAYRCRAGHLYPLTRDHTMVEAWILSGQLSKEQAQGHPDAHRITRALGISPQVEVEVRPSEEVRVGDRILLCTDGLTDLVSEAELTALLSGSLPADPLVAELIRLANQRGGHDNITAVVVDIQSPVPQASPLGGGVNPTPNAPPVANLRTVQAELPETVLGTAIGTLVGAPPAPVATQPDLGQAPAGQAPAGQAPAGLAPALSTDNAFPKTVPIGMAPSHLDRTIVMGARTEAHDYGTRSSPAELTVPATGRFEPSSAPPHSNLASPNTRTVLAELPTSPTASSITPAARSARRMLWVTLAIGLCLVGLALLIPLLRHR